MLTVGVDLAADPSNTAVCGIDWSVRPPAVRVLPEAVTDEGLVTVAQHAGKVGIDCPFGWPEPFVEAVSAHSRGEAWPGREEPPGAYRRRLSYRTTDLTVWDLIGRPPLSVAADRIGVTAMRLSALLDRLAYEGHPVDRAGTGTVAEVYPAAALWRWALPHRGYKGPAGAVVRESVADQLLAALPLAVEHADMKSLRSSDDAFDALVAALVARAAALGWTAPPSREQHEVARTEGWIHVPTAPLGALTHGAAPVH